MISDIGECGTIKSGRPVSWLLGLLVCLLAQFFTPSECFAFPVDREWEKLSRDASRAEFKGDTSKAMLLIDQSISATKITAPASDQARISLKKCRMLVAQGYLPEAIAQANGAAKILSPNIWQDKIVSYQINRAVAEWCLRTNDAAGAVRSAKIAVALNQELDSEMSLEHNRAAMQLVEALVRAKMFKEVLDAVKANDEAFELELKRAEVTIEQVELLCGLGISKVALGQKEAGYALLNRSMDLSRRLNVKWTRHHVAQQILESGISLDDKPFFAKLSSHIHSLEPANRDSLEPFIRRHGSQ